ncbi:MAG: hypothetical protein LBU32_03020 [Clostridiales bacterium]|nr:hypothetical protein [Clostridiales bacterium]
MEMYFHKPSTALDSESGKSNHATCPVETLPYHHRDPFDRLLISTAIAENMTFLSADENVPKYAVSWLW